MLNRQNKFSLTVSAAFIGAFVAIGGAAGYMSGKNGWTIAKLSEGGIRCLDVGDADRWSVSFADTAIDTVDRGPRLQ